MPDFAEIFRFDVAFSFAGPHREKVRQIAQLVARNLGKERVFFDEWYEHEILGDDMDVLLQRFYHEQSLLVIADLSEDYAGRPWCQAEARAIRALRFQIDPARDEAQRLRLLNARLGPGNVPGVFVTAGYLDGINKTEQECAELILKRLDLLRQRLGRMPNLKTESGCTSAAPCWPETEPPLVWPMADHTGVRQAFASLLTRGAPRRFLAIRGPSETGKSHITRQMLANAIPLAGISCGRFDFKGTTDVEAELRSFVQFLQTPLPQRGIPLTEALAQILASLKQRAQPTLLIFDTFEASGEAEDWVDKQLLPNLLIVPWLRVVVAGQEVPDATSAVWISAARAPIQLFSPPPEDWLTFGQPHKKGLTLDFVRQAHELCGGRSSLLAQLLGPTR